MLAGRATFCFACSSSSSSCPSCRSSHRSWLRFSCRRSPPRAAGGALRAPAAWCRRAPGIADRASRARRWSMIVAATMMRVHHAGRAGTAPGRVGRPAPGHGLPATDEYTVRSAPRPVVAPRPVAAARGSRKDSGPIVEIARGRLLAGARKCAKRRLYDSKCDVWSGGGPRHWFGGAGGTDRPEIRQRERDRDDSGDRQGKPARHSQRRERRRRHDAGRTGHEAVRRAEGRRQGEDHVHRIAGPAGPQAGRCGQGGRRRREAHEGHGRIPRRHAGAPADDERSTSWPSIRSSRRLRSRPPTGGRSRARSKTARTSKA